MKRALTAFLALAMLITLTASLAGCGAKSPTVMKIGEYKVSYDLLKYFALNYRDEYEKLAPGKLYVDEELQKKLVEDTNYTLRTFAAYYELIDKYKLKLTDEQKKSVDEQIDSLRATYASQEAFENDLATNHTNVNVLREIFTMQAYCDVLYGYLTDEYHGIFLHDDATIMEDVEKGNYYSDEYVVIHYESGNMSARRDIAEDIRSRVANGESMEKISKEYHDQISGKYFDEESLQYLDELIYYKNDVFAVNEMLSYFRDAITMLDVGEVSPVVDTSAGFMVVKRLDLDLDKNFNSIIASYLSRQFFDYVEQYGSELELSFVKKYSDIVYWEME